MKGELKILDWIQGLRTPAGDAVLPVISALGNAGIIWIVLAGALLLISKKRKSGFILAAALCVDLILCNLILKNVFCRIRPCDVNTAIDLLVARPTDYSFPSGHTAASFASVAALYFAKEKRLQIPALVLAVVIAFSRMYLYVHYPTDILGGIVVGIIAGYAGYRIVEVLEKRLRRSDAGM